MCLFVSFEIYLAFWGPCCGEGSAVLGCCLVFGQKPATVPAKRKPSARSGASEACGSWPGEGVLVRCFPLTHVFPISPCALQACTPPKHPSAHLSWHGCWQPRPIPVFPERVRNSGSQECLCRAFMVFFATKKIFSAQIYDVLSFFVPKHFQRNGGT